MAKSQTLQTYIRINATAGGFGEVQHEISAMGDTLLELGAYANQVSQELINFGKDSVKTYKEYEKSLAEAEVALATTYGQNSAQLADVMKQLDEQATQWAATTIFHTDDVANAIAEASRSGWDLERILTGIPAAMELAQAGSMDLSESVDMIVKIANAAGIEFEDIGGFIDHWAYSANSSATTIEEMGEAMMRMGGTMRFAENTDEMLTLIAAMANMGYTGSEAGTLIRNTMLRLIAPTDKASDAMALLGASAEEVEAAMADEKVAESLAALEEVGFSAFDNTGTLKPTLQIFEELGVALSDLAGGYDKIASNDKAVSILSSIFPTRTITGAINLLQSAADGWDGLYDSLQGGRAEGYGTYASETMMDTLYGNIEIFYSKLEALREHVGSALSEDVTGVMSILGNMIDSVNNMDEGSFNALVSGLEVIATVGPALMFSGLGMKALTALLTPAGGLAVAAIAVTALAAAFKELQDADIKSHFGEASIDREVVESYATMVQEEYSSAFDQVAKFNGAVVASVKLYKDSSTQLSGQLLTAMLSKKELSDEDITNINGLAESMHKAVMDAIAESNAATMSYWDILFGSPEEGEIPDEYHKIWSLSNDAYQEAVNNATQIGQNVREALTDAFADGQVSTDEYNRILDYMRAYNDAVAEAEAQAAAEDRAAQMSVMLHKAQTASMDSVLSTSSEIAQTRNAELQAEDERYWAERGRLEYRWNQRIAEGRYVDPNTGMVYTDPAIISRFRDYSLAKADERYATQRGSLSASSDEVLLALWQSTLAQSDYSSLFAGLQAAAQTVTSGQTGIGESASGIRKAYTDGDLWQLQQVFPQMVKDLGGIEAMTSRAEEYARQGNEEMAYQMAQMANMSLILSQASSGGMENFAAHDRGDIDWQEHQGTAEPIVLTFDAETSLADEKLQGLNGQQLTENVDGDTTQLHNDIAAEDGQTLTAYVDYVPLNNPDSYVKGNDRRFATGGRATEPSIFGDAGPEWAIPEEHSQRTAELLNRARAASGFTWPDLLSRLGGMNAGTGTPATIVYSPTINANDVTGVKQALDADKARFEKWFAEREARNAIEVYT